MMKTKKVFYKIGAVYSLPSGRRVALLRQGKEYCVFELTEESLGRCKRLFGPALLGECRNFLRLLQARGEE